MKKYPLRENSDMKHYEIHITIFPKDAEKLNSFCKDHGFKNTHILNESGYNPSQSMLCTKETGNSHKEVICIAKDIDKMLFEYGIQSARVKVEQLVSKAVADKNPKTSEDTYFETHFQLVIPTIAVGNLVKNEFNGALWSTNITKYPAEDTYPRQLLLTFQEKKQNVDFKDYNVILEKARDKLKELEVSFTYHREMVVYDSFPEMDSGWISTFTL